MLKAYWKNPEGEYDKELGKYAIQAFDNGDGRIHFDIKCEKYGLDVDYIAPDSSGRYYMEFPDKTREIEIL